MKKGLTRLAEANVKNISLTNFDVIAEVAAEEGYIKPEDIVIQEQDFLAQNIWRCIRSCHSALIHPRSPRRSMI